MNQDDPRTDTPTILGLIGERLHMTEGQLYTVALTALAVVLLTLTGLPTAHQAANGDGVEGPAPPVPTTEVQP